MLKQCIRFVGRRSIGDESRHPITGHEEGWHTNGDIPKIGTEVVLPSAATRWYCETSEEILVQEHTVLRCQSSANSYKEVVVHSTLRAVADNTLLWIITKGKLISVVHINRAVLFAKKKPRKGRILDIGWAAYLRRRFERSRHLLDKVV